MLPTELLHFRHLVEDLFCVLKPLDQLLVLRVHYVLDGILRPIVVLVEVDYSLYVRINDELSLIDEIHLHGLIGHSEDG